MDPKLGNVHTITLDPEDSKENQEQTIQSLNDSIPDKFSGWGLMCIISAFLININTWGTNSAFALYYQKFLNEDIFPGATKIQFGTVAGLTYIGSAFGFLINYSVGKIGVKQVMTMGTMVQNTGILLASFSTKMWELVLTEGFLQGIGMGFAFSPIFLIIPQWFKGGTNGKRNLALGLQSAGGGVGGIIYNVAMEPMMVRFGWRWSLRTQALISLAMNICCIMLVKMRDKDIRPVYKLYDKKVWGTFGCHMTVVWIMFTLIGYVTLVFNLGDFTRSMGYGSKEASVVSTMVSVGSIIGRPIVGVMADRMGPIQVSIAMSWITCIITLGMWIPCKTYGTAIAFALIEGAIMGSLWVCMGPINAAIIGIRKLGVGMSISQAGTGIFGFLSPIIGIALKRDSLKGRGQYRNVAIFIGCCYFGAGLAMWILRGWFIARQKKVTKGMTEEERLELRVSTGETMKYMMDVHPYKV